MQWETVIGLEVHVQLATQSKIFSGASTAFGAPPNTQACAVDLAMPGTLPVLNERAVHLAIMFGLAIDAKINQHSVFERKNYFYPDLPKGYQTTQLAQPIVEGGLIDIQLPDNSTKTIRIHHAHLEEDAGKSLHEDFAGKSAIDLNRAGTPLLEIVTEPDMRSKQEAVAFAKKLHAIVTSLGISDGDMSQGSMRFDVNVSVRIKGEQTLGTRTETKNLNSFRFMEEAIALEVDRQIDLLEYGETVEQETRLYNSVEKTSRAMRSKEEANDYRYFPCPDLLPVLIDDDTITGIAATLPELPDARRERFVNSYGLSNYDADILCAEHDMANYFEAVAKTCDDPKLAANWIMGELTARLNAAAADGGTVNIALSPVSAEQLGKLIIRIKDNTISGKIAKQVFDSMWNQEGDADTIISAKGLKQVCDSDALSAIVDEVLANNPQGVEQYRNADDKKRKKLLGGFMGPIMKATKGQANPGMVNKILLQKLNG